MSQLRNDFRGTIPAVLPSMLLCDFGNLKAEIERLHEAGARGLHLDVMDGRFVPNLTYGMPIVAAVRKLTHLPIDVHLMIEEPSNYLRAFADAGADLITVHVEAVKDVPQILHEIHDLGVQSGLALNPDTPVEAVLPHVEACDLVLVMSVPAGFGGQAFRPNSLDKLRRLRESRADLLLEVDGGINEQTIGACRQAGADLFVVGSAIFRADSYRVALERLNQAIDSRSCDK